MRFNYQLGQSGLPPYHPSSFRPNGLSIGASEKSQRDPLSYREFLERELLERTRKAEINKDFATIDRQLNVSSIGRHYESEIFYPPPPIIPKYPELRMESSPLPGREELYMERRVQMGSSPFLGKQEPLPREDPEKRLWLGLGFGPEPVGENRFKVGSMGDTNKSNSWDDERLMPNPVLPHNTFHPFPNREMLPDDLAYMHGTFPFREMTQPMPMPEISNKKRGKIEKPDSRSCEWIEIHTQPQSKKSRTKAESQLENRNELSASQKKWKENHDESASFVVTTGQSPQEIENPTKAAQIPADRPKELELPVNTLHPADKSKVLEPPVNRFEQRAAQILASKPKELEPPVNMVEHNAFQILAGKSKELEPPVNTLEQKASQILADKPKELELPVSTLEQKAFQIPADKPKELEPPVSTLEQKAFLIPADRPKELEPPVNNLEQKAAHNLPEKLKTEETLVSKGVQVEEEKELEPPVNDIGSASLTKVKEEAPQVQASVNESSASSVPPLNMLQQKSGQASANQNQEGAAKIIPKIPEKKKFQAIEPEQIRIQNKGFFCTLCSVKTTSRHDLDAHLQGKRHLTNLAFLSNDPSTKFELKKGDSNTSTSTPSTSNSSNRMEERNLHWCYLCNVKCYNPANLAQHFNGKKHQEAQRKASLPIKRSEKR